jgi:Domain of unknown function (DUF6468)
MSPIAMIMNGLLGVLLVGALFVGWRLEGRLKALRASHLSFARAVEDLDRAAARAEQGLADLRAATDEAAEGLSGRIERAKGLTARLERLTEEATVAEARLAAAPRPSPAPAPAASSPAAPPQGRDNAFARFAERYGATHRAAAEAPRARHDLILEDEPDRAQPSAQPAALRPRILAEARAPLPFRSPRARVDDELFETPAPRAAVGGAR